MKTSREILKEVVEKRQGKLSGLIWDSSYFEAGLVWHLLITDTAMCSSGFETQNLKYKTNDDSRTNVKERTKPAIAYSRC